MKKPHILCTAILAVMAMLTITSCKDYQDDIDEWSERVDSLEQYTASLQRQLKSIEYAPEYLGAPILVDGTQPVTITYQVEPKLQADSIQLNKSKLQLVCKLNDATESDYSRAALDIVDVKGNGNTGVLKIEAIPNDMFDGTHSYAVMLQYNHPIATYRTSFTPIRVLTHPEALTISMAGGASPSAQEHAAGSSIQLMVAYTPVYTTETGVTWTSSNPQVATIDDNGLLTALDNGIATVTVTSTDNEVSDAVTITVKGGFIDIETGEEKDPAEAE